MSRRSTPERINEARRAALRNRLTGTGMTAETAEAWILAWMALAGEQGVDPARDYWTRAWAWISLEREAGRKP